MALRELDGVLEKAGNLGKLSAALEAALEEDPVAFFTKYVMPLVPREQLLRLETTKRVGIRIEFGMDTEPATTTTPEGDDDAA